MLHGKVWLIVFLFLFVAAGCRSSSSLSESEATLTEAAVPDTRVPASPIGLTSSPLAVTTSPTMHPSATPFPSRTQTATVVPRATATATLTPMPTLPPEEAEAFILDLLQNDAECPLPCWWGFVPGETSWAEAQNVLATFALEIARGGPSDRPLYTVYIPVPEELHPSTHLVYEYRVRTGTIGMIEVMFALEHYEEYTLAQILNTYGQPAEVWIRTFDRSRDMTLPFYVVLFYPRHGFMIRYYDDAELTGETVRACFHQEEYRPLLWVWSPQEEMSFRETAASTTNFGLDEEKEYRPLEEVTTMDVEMFFRQFSQAEDLNCLETPASLWPPP